MEKVFAKVDELVGSLKAYADNRIESIKFNAAEKSSAIAANFLAGFFISVVLIFFIGLVSVAISLLLGKWLNILWLGFLIVAVFYLLMGILLWKFRVRLIRLPLMNALLKQLIVNDYEED